MPTTTIRVPQEKRDILKVIAATEKREMKEILTELIDDYIERHQETLELLSRPEWIKMIESGKEEVVKGVKGKSLDEAENLERHSNPENPACPVGGN